MYFFISLNKLMEIMTNAIMNHYNDLSNFFSMMPEDAVQFAWLVMVVAIKIAANSADNITTANIIDNCGESITYEQLMASLLNAWQIGHNLLGIPIGVWMEGLHRVADVPVAVAHLQPFFNVQEYVVATYLPESGINSYWLEAYLQSIDNDFTRQMVTELASFRRS